MQCRKPAGIRCLGVMCIDSLLDPDLGFALQETVSLSQNTPSAYSSAHLLLSI